MIYIRIAVAQFDRSFLASIWGTTRKFAENGSKKNVSHLGGFKIIASLVPDGNIADFETSTWNHDMLPLYAFASLNSPETVPLCATMRNYDNVQLHWSCTDCAHHFLCPSLKRVLVPRHSPPTRHLSPGRMDHQSVQHPWIPAMLSSS